MENQKAAGGGNVFLRVKTEKIAAQEEENPAPLFYDLKTVNPLIRFPEDKQFPELIIFHSRFL